MKTRRIGVVAPSFTHRSAGIFMMHYLVHQLRELGFDAYWIPQGGPLAVHQRFDTPHVNKSGCSGAEIAEEWIVIYPEGIFGNPLNAKHVVRYLLNRESAFGGPGMGASPEDYLLTYSRWFHPTAPVLYYPVFEGELLIRSARLNGEEPRTLDAYYIGKGAALGPCAPVARAVEITRAWPENKSKLYDLLENIRIFYSYDWLSSTLADAALMGCEVRLIGKPGKLGVEELLNSPGMPDMWERASDHSVFMRSASRPKFLESIQSYRADFTPSLLRTFREISRHFAP